MLVLSRKSQESVIVGGGGAFPGLLKVTVIAVTGDKVKLGFEADADVPVDRLEVWERKRAEVELHRHGAGPKPPHVASS